MKSIYIYGGSGHGHVVADIARACGYENLKFVDDGENDYPSFNAISTHNKVPMIVAIGDNRIRSKLTEKAKNAGFEIVSLIHPSSVISLNVTIGKGTVVMPQVVVNIGAKIGEGVILNSGCVVEHECVIDDFVHISPKVALAGNAKVGKFTHIGIGSNIIQCITIGNNSIIGAGSTVVSSVGNFKKAYGNPCKVIGNIDE